MTDGLILLAMPARDIQEQIYGEIAFHGLPDVRGNALCPMDRLHQSLSHKYPPDALQAMLRAGRCISAPGVKLVFNRIVSSGEVAGSIHWVLKIEGSDPEDFTGLVNAAALCLRAHGLYEPSGHSAHITLSYFAEIGLSKSLFLKRRIVWPIDRIVLARAGGRPYRYEVIEEWPLLPLRQAELFPS